jgi:hypothetical protein
MSSPPLADNPRKAGAVVFDVFLAGVVLTLTHVACLAVLWIFFALLRWTGEDGMLGLIVRGIGSIPIVVLGWAGAAIASHVKGRPGFTLVTATLLGLGYLALMIFLGDAVRASGHGSVPLIFPRAGQMTASPDGVALLAAAFANPAIVMILAFAQTAFAAHKARAKEHMLRRLYDAPCVKCHGRMVPKPGHLECAACGLVAPLPNEADAEALARAFEIRAPR